MNTKTAIECKQNLASSDYIHKIFLDLYFYFSNDGHLICIL